MDTDLDASRVRGFWQTEPCGTHFITDFRDRRDFFRKYREFRYRTEWHIPAFARFSEATGQRMLEIGCGNGAEAFMFASHHARYTGIDLTAAAVEATREHLACEGVEGEVHQENAEHLSFRDHAFHLVYSFGVLHHTPHPELAVREVYRVLRPGGQARIMLYHRHSFNYYIRILMYMRARVLCKVLSRAARWRKDRSCLEPSAVVGIRGNASPNVWQLHYENFLRQGWRYLASDNFTHHCADGPECPYAYVYTKRQVRSLFSRFSSVDVRVAHLPLNKYRWGRWLPRAIEQVLARQLGWHLLITAIK